MMPYIKQITFRLLKVKDVTSQTGAEGGSERIKLEVRYTEH
jgi:hypothetical protein